MRTYQRWTEKHIQTELENVIELLGRFPSQKDLKLHNNRLLQAIYRFKLSLSYFRSKFGMVDNARNNKHLTLPDLTSRQLQLVNGSLLGDGTLQGSKKHPHRNWCFRKSQSKFDCKKIDKTTYMQWHIDELTPYSKTSVYKGKSKSKQIYGNCKTTPPCDYYAIRTCADPVFTQLAKKWYKHTSGIFERDHNGCIIKYVPKDIKLTPLTVAVWYCDDGINIPQHRTAQFCTDSFSISDVEYLIEEFKQLGISAFRCQSSEKKPNIKIKTSSYLDFINMVSCCFDWECFSYKINIDKYTPPKQKAKGEKCGNVKLTDDKVKKIRNEWSNGKSCKELSFVFGVSESTIYHIIDYRTWKHI